MITCKVVWKQWDDVSLNVGIQTLTRTYNISVKGVPYEVICHPVFKSKQ